jgi:hypothetical protein
VDQADVDRILKHEHRRRLLRRSRCRCGVPADTCGFRQVALEAQLRLSSREREERVRRLVLDDQEQASEHRPPLDDVR